jgi:hypothetical protein
VKSSLISATSLIALFAISSGQAQAAAQAPSAGAPYIFDLIQDDAASLSDGDTPGAGQDAVAYAIAALNAADKIRPPLSFTGPVDRSAAAGKAYPAIPLGAARGTETDDAVATSLVGSGTMTALQKERAVGMTRLASFVGTIGDGPPPTEKKPGSTVFVEASIRAEFNDSTAMANGFKGAPGSYAFSSTSTATATITVVSAGILSRQRVGGVAYTSVAKTLQPNSAGADDSGTATAQNETVQPAFSYSYAPIPSNTANSASVAASFSEAITASGTVAHAESTVERGSRMADMMTPADLARVQTSQLQPGQGRPLIGTIQESQAQPGLTQSVQAPAGKVQTSQVQTGTSKLQTSELQPGAARSADLPNGKVQTSQVQTGPGKLQTSELQSGAAQSADLPNGKVQTSQVQTGAGKLQTSELQSGAAQSADLPNGKLQTSQLQSGAGKLQTSELQPGARQSGNLPNGKLQTSQLQTGAGKLQTSELQPGTRQSGNLPGGTLQMSELQSGTAQPAKDQPLQFKSVDSVIKYYKLLDYTQTATLQGSDGQGDNTRAFVSPSVSVDPSAAATHYFLSSLNPAPANGSTIQSAQSFYIGTPTAPSLWASSPVKAPIQEATIPAPLGGKILASAGPLNNSLALP